MRQKKGTSYAWSTLVYFTYARYQEWHCILDDENKGTYFKILLTILSKISVVPWTNESMTSQDILRYSLRSKFVMYLHTCYI